MGKLMTNSNYKLYLNCILSKYNYSFIKNSSNSVNTNLVLISNKILYYIALHIRFSTIFYSSQLIDIFSYELMSHKSTFSKKSFNSIVVYNFNFLNDNSKFILFIKNGSVVDGIDTFSKKKKFKFNFFNNGGFFFG